MLIPGNNFKIKTLSSKLVLTFSFFVVFSSPFSYIVYESNVNEQKLITTVKIYNNTLSLIRIGDVHSRQVFTEEKWHTCYHYVAGSSLILRSYTKRLEHLINPEGGSLNLLYDLWSGKTHMGHFCLDLIMC